MVDESDLYNDDLYGDLDEDLDTAQLEEELVDPDEQPPARLAPQTDPAPQVAQEASSSTAPPAQQGFQPQSALGYPVGQAAGQGQGQAVDQDALDRIRPSDMPDEGKMFIGGLNWETTDDGLRAYMAQYGEIDACTIMRDPTGRSRGFAFLTYKHASSVTKVMAQNHHLDGKQIDPKRAIPRAEHERTAKVFVGGLAPTVTSESLKEFLTRFGIVMDATVMFDRETTRSKGFAFATFADEDSVQRAMDASGIELEGKPIEIKKAQPRGAGTLVKNFGGKPNFQQGPGFNAGGGMGGMGGGGGGGGGGGFDPNAMAMMYQNMMKGGMGGGMAMGGGFDPNAMAMMYQNMMKGMGGMGNAPAINPNMASNMMRNGMGGGMGMMGMNNMGMGNMMGMGGMGMGMGGMGGMGFNNGGMMNNRPMGNTATRPPNAPRGPAAMRGPGQGTGTGVAAPMSQQGAGAQRYTTQGNARSKPY